MKTVVGLPDGTNVVFVGCYPSLDANEKLIIDNFEDVQAVYKFTDYTAVTFFPTGSPLSQ